MTNPVPFKDRHARISPSQFKPLRKLLENMEEVEAIRKSNSPWSSSIVLVKKKDRNLRFCIDLRKLNARMAKDAYALPRIEETLDYLVGSKWFSALDLKSGYWQVKLDEESKPLITFTVGPLGFYECEQMPFGATNAPATFQRMIETCLGDLHLNWCLIYLDDIIVFAKTQQEAITRLGAIFQKLREVGLKLQPSKCELFKTSLLYLGHIVSKDGIRTDPKKVEAVLQWPVQVTVTDVRCFLGLTNYYRRFLKGYAKITRPLTNLISGENVDKKKALVVWTPKCQQAFEQLKKLCTDALVLAYPDFTKPFKLHIDACDRSLWAILYQDQPDGKEKPISFASRSLNKAESNYPVHKLEFLALKWAITKRFHEYLYRNDFTVYTNNNPLTYILTTAKLDATSHRWVAALVAYNFTLNYRPGKANIDADPLSRIPWNKAQMVEPETVGHLLGNVISKVGCVIECYKGHITTVLEPLPRAEPGKMSVIDWVAAQWEEKGLRKVIELYEAKKLTKSHRGEGLDMGSQEERGLWHNRSWLVMRQGLLYRKVMRPGENVACMQFVLLSKYRKMAIQGCYDDVGHMGVAQSVNLLQDWFYWPGMAKEMTQHVRKCMRCNCFKKRAEQAPLEPILAMHPMQIVHIDFLTIELGKTDKDHNVLVVTDQFTRFAQAFITTSQTAQTTAKTLWDKYFVYYGFLEMIISDQGRNFKSRVISELCELGRVKKLRTSPISPSK